MSVRTLNHKDIGRSFSPKRMNIKVYQASSEIISNTDCWKHTFNQSLPFVNRNWHFS